MSDAEYIPPTVWTYEEGDGGRWSSINRPFAGPRHEAALPRGEHPLQLYSMGTPNGVKVTIMLEELLALGHTGAEYDAWLIKIGDGEQFSTGFVEVNPNSKIPAIVDYSEPKPLRIFETASIVLYLAEKFGAFLPTDRQRRTETLNWVFWNMGSAPFVGGGFGHFYAYAPSKMKYPIDRYTMETKRLLDVLNRELETKAYISGDDYTIADIVNWPWYGNLALGRLYDAGEFLDVKSYTNVVRWAETLAERPAVQRGRMVNRTSGEPSEQLHERHDASDFETKTQDKIAAT